jgi:uncharacterized phage protein (TIGR01671 family)
MRDILFRGKTYNDKWVQGLLVQMDDHLTQIRKLGSDGIGYYDYSIVPSTVGQYTGLTDRNGKKIFEGDIIKIVPYYDYSDDYSISKVYSYNGIFCVDYHGDDFDSTALGFLVDYLPDGDFEVIGNIHDNPELLEVSE